DPAPDAAPDRGGRRLSRMLRRLALPALLLSLLPGVGRAAAPSPLLPDAVRERAEALRNDASSGTQALEIARSLTFEAGPRAGGAAGGRAAVAWGLGPRRGLGFENVHAEPVTVPHWDRGTIAGEILSPWPQPVVLTSLGGSVGTPDAGIEAEVLAVPSLEAV